MATDSGHKASKSGQSKKKKALRLNPREKRLKKNLLSGKFDTLQDAMIDAGYPESTAKKAAGRTVGSRRMQSALQKAIEKAGLTDDKLLSKLTEGLDSNRVISAIAGKEANGGTTDFVEVPDYQTRHKYLDTAFKLKGHYIDKVEHSGEVAHTVEVVNFKGASGKIERD